MEQNNGELNKCSICKKILNISLFYKRGDSPNKYRSACKNCYTMKINAVRNTEKYKEKLKNYYASDSYKLRIKKRNQTTKYKEYLANYKKSDKWSSYQKAFKKKYHQTTAFKEWKKERYKTDIQYKLSQNLRNRLRAAIKLNYKTGSAIKDLGCSLDSLKGSIESKFKNGMTWGNYGKWHIDHIKPLALFDLTDRKQLLEAVNFNNLQPLWAFDNRSKGSKIYE